MKTSKIPKRSILIRHGVKLEPHEFDTVMFLLRVLQYCCIELIPPSLTPGRKNADFLIDSILWESKSPTKNDAEAIKRIFRKAGNQSQNLIFDLRRLKGDDAKIIACLEKYFTASRKIRRIMIITKTETLITHKK